MPSTREFPNLAPRHKKTKSLRARKKTLKTSLMQRNRKKTTTSRSCIEINGGERETLHRYLVRSTITNAPSGLFKRHTRNKSTRAPTETTASILLQNLPKKARKIEEKEENPMMVFPMRRKFLRANSPNSARRQIKIRREERKRDTGRARLWSVGAQQCALASSFTQRTHLLPSAYFEW